MIGYILIGPWTLFSSYVLECKLFGVCVVGKGAEKTRFLLRNDTKCWMRAFHIPVNIDISQEVLAKAINHYSFQMGPKFLLNIILCA